MQNIQDLKEKIFFESKNIIDILYKIDNVDELLSKQDLVDELANRISFLRLLEKNIEYFIPENNSQSLENKQNISFTNITEAENNESTDGVVEEEVIFNNELNEIDGNEKDIQNDFTQIADKSEIEEQVIVSNVSIEQGEIEMKASNVENILNEIKIEAQHEEKNEGTLISESIDRGTIIEIERPISEIKEDQYSDEKFENNTDAYHQEKKIKLASIKGLKTVQTLFDDDPLEGKNIVESSIKEDSGNVLKTNTNVLTDFTEAEKSKPEFKLDLNDRIAFSKMLFGGNQSKLNEVVYKLNSFKTLDEAKEYLSDLYYAKKWHKVDEYAQRLWMLVENKFL